jgi:hypothetical protein
MKEKLNMLLEEELQCMVSIDFWLDLVCSEFLVMQEEYAFEIGLDKTGRGASWYSS